MAKLGAVALDLFPDLKRRNVFSHIPITRHGMAYLDGLPSVVFKLVAFFSCCFLDEQSMEVGFRRLSSPPSRSNGKGAVIIQSFPFRGLFTSSPTPGGESFFRSPLHRKAVAHENGISKEIMNLEIGQIRLFFLCVRIPERTKVDEVE